MTNAVRTAPIHVFTPAGAEQRDDLLAAEEPIEIRLAHGVGGERRRFTVAVTMRTPGNDEDLALGFLFTEGIIGSKADVLTVRPLQSSRDEEDAGILVELRPGLQVDEARLTRHLFAASSCGLCGKASLEAVYANVLYRAVPAYPQIGAGVLYQLPDTLRRTQATFETTGGLHAAGLFDAGGKLLLLREDVGRHNAVDKVIGAALREGLALPFKDCLLLVSGRAGFELVQKAASAGLPLLAAVGAPSSLALEMAEAVGMTLVGFLRGERFNVYTGRERISVY